MQEAVQQGQDLRLEYAVRGWSTLHQWPLRLKPHGQRPVRQWPGLPEWRMYDRVLDEWELRPGLPWQEVLEEQIGQVRAAAVFIGKSGLGPWQNVEMKAFIRQFVKRGCPVIPVVLKDATKKPKLPPFLEGMTWVDFRKDEPDPFDQLVWGITGERPHER